VKKVEQGGSGGGDCEEGGGKQEDGRKIHLLQVGHDYQSLEKGDAVTLVGFGTFSVIKRRARVGRNPQTGKEIKIPAKKVVKFTPGKALKIAVNKS